MVEIMYHVAYDFMVSFGLKRCMCGSLKATILYQGDMVFSGCNKLVRSNRPTCIAVSLTVGLQELMKNGDPKDYVETAKLASVMMDVYVCSRPGPSYPPRLTQI